jgi:hypothetical protein
VHSPAPYTGHYAITGRVPLYNACTIPPALPTLRARAYTLRPHYLRCPPQLPSHRCRRPPPAFSLPSAGGTTRRRTIGLEGVVELVARLLLRLSLSLHLFVMLGKISMRKARVTSPLTASCSGCARASLGSLLSLSVPNTISEPADGRRPCDSQGAGAGEARKEDGGPRRGVEACEPAVSSGGARARELMNDGRAGPVTGPGLASPASKLWLPSNGAALMTVFFGLFVRGFTRNGRVRAVLDDRRELAALPERLEAHVASPRRCGCRSWSVHAEALELAQHVQPVLGPLERERVEGLVVRRVAHGPPAVGLGERVEEGRRAPDERSADVVVALLSVRGAVATSLHDLQVHQRAPDATCAGHVRRSRQTPATRRT